MCIAWAPAYGAGAVASPDGGVLELRLREQLNRMFRSDEYLLDLQLHSIDVKKRVKAVDEALPGLSYGLSGDGGGSDVDANADIYEKLKADVMFVADVDISVDRIKLAEEVIRRVVIGQGLGNRLSLVSKQQEIFAKKVEPPEPTPPPVKDLFSLIQDNKDVLIRILILLWAAAASLIAVIGLMRRFSNPQAATTGPQPFQPRFDPSGSRGGDPNNSAAPGKAPTVNDEAYSKDQAQLDQIQDLVQVASENAPKVAKVITRWVGLSDDNARYAAIFFKSCNLKTIESIAALLHPSDIEKIMKHNISPFFALGAENIKVIDLMRSDLALLAAEKVLRDRPEPLDFFKTLSDDDVIAVLEDEPLHVVALISTQIPAHRMQKFFASLDSNVLNSLCAMISTLESPSVEVFNAIREVMLTKTKSLGSTFVNEKVRSQTLIQVMQVVQSPKKLIDAARILLRENPAIYKTVRPTLLIPLDFNHMPSSVTTLLSQSIDADVMAEALAGLGIDFTRLIDMLPEVYRAVFTDKMSRDVDPASQVKNWLALLQAIRDLVGTGFITEAELVTARMMTDEMLGSFGAQEDSPHVAA